MGITIGDVLTVIATVGTISLSIWALILCVAFLFGDRTAHAKRSIERSAWREGLIGVFVLLTLGFVSVVLTASPLPIAKIVGLLGYFALVLIASIGGAGLSSLVAERMMKRDPRVSSTHALGKSAGLMIVACIMPILGWFVLGPILTILCLGSGTHALISKRAESSAGLGTESA